MQPVVTVVTVVTVVSVAALGAPLTPKAVDAVALLVFTGFHLGLTSDTSLTVSWRHGVRSGTCQSLGRVSKGGDGCGLSDLGFANFKIWFEGHNVNHMEIISDQIL